MSRISAKSDGSAGGRQSGHLGQSVSFNNIFGASHNVFGSLFGSSKHDRGDQAPQSARRWPSLAGFWRGSRVDGECGSSSTIGGHFRRPNFQSLRKNDDDKLGAARRGATSAKDEIERIIKQELSKFDFAIRDDSFAEQRSFGFTSSEVYAPVDDSYAPVVGNIFSWHSKVYHGLMILLAVASCVLIPLRHSFFLKTSLDGKLYDKFLAKTCNVINILYGIRFIWSLRFSVVEAQFNNFNPSFIVRSKLHNWEAWLDLGSIALSIAGALHEESYEGIDSIVVVLAFAQVIRCWRLLRKAPCFQLHRNRAGVGLMRLFFFVCIQAHVIACLWYYICTNVAGSFEAHLESTLGAHSGRFFLGGEEHDAVHHYMFAYREVWMMIVSDTRPALSNQELLLSIVMAPLGGMIMALLLAETIQLIHHMNLLRESQAEQLAFATQALRSMSVPGHLAERILSYQQYMQHVHNRDAMRVLFENLSSPLALELQLTLFHGLIAETPFFANASANILKCIVMALEDCFFQPGDFVIRKTEPATEMFFVVRGICEVIPELDLGVVKVFQNGDYFGEIALLRDGDAPRTAWIRAAVYSHLCQLAKDDFSQVMETFPEQKAMLVQRLQLFEAQHTGTAAVSNRFSQHSEGNWDDDFEPDSPIEEEEDSLITGGDGATSGMCEEVDFSPVIRRLSNAETSLHSGSARSHKTIEAQSSVRSVKSYTEALSSSTESAEGQSPYFKERSSQESEGGGSPKGKNLAWKNFQRDKGTAPVTDSSVRQSLKRSQTTGFSRPSAGSGSVCIQSTGFSRPSAVSGSVCFSDEIDRQSSLNSRHSKESKKDTRQMAMSKVKSLGASLAKAVVGSSKSSREISKPSAMRRKSNTQDTSDNVPMTSMYSVSSKKVQGQRSLSLFNFNNPIKPSAVVTSGDSDGDYLGIDRTLSDRSNGSDVDEGPDMQVRMGHQKTTGATPMDFLKKTKTLNNKSSKRHHFKAPLQTVSKRPSALASGSMGISSTVSPAIGTGAAEALDRKMDLVLTEIRDLSAVVGPLAMQVSNISRSLTLEAANSKLKTESVVHHSLPVPDEDNSLRSSPIVSQPSQSVSFVQFSEDPESDPMSSASSNRNSKGDLSNRNSTGDLSSGPHKIAQKTDLSSMVEFLEDGPEDNQNNIEV